jgi:tRNA threonylcarbamoyladenosine biosynthesis protein TsaB
VSFYLLAVDATGERGSIALLNERNILEEVALHAPDGFAHILFGEMQRLLARHGLTFESLHGFASASGPGSFTGVRVGLTAVMGLAEATGRQVVAVSNLRAIASFGTRRLRAAVIDARRGEVYGGVYDAQLLPVCQEVVTKLPLWLESLPKDGLEADDLEIVTQGLAIVTQHPVVEAPQALAGAIGRIAFDHFMRGEACDPAQMDANYVRRSDAELLWKDPVLPD